MSLANEGRMSAVVAISAVSTPAGMTPGHQVMVGSRM